MSKINTRELSALTQEAADLSNKAKLSEQEQRRFKYLTSAIAAVRSGASLDDFNRDQLNEVAAQNGLPQVRIKRSRKQERRRARGEFFQQMIRGNCGGSECDGGIEYRANEADGNIPVQLGTYTGIGNFVPTDLFDNIKERLAEIDVLFDPNGPCTVIQDTKGTPKRITFFNDTLVDTAQVGEGVTDGSITLLQNLGHVTLGSYGFRTPVHPVTMEACADIHEMIDVADLFERFSSKRLARTIGQRMISGTGSGQTLGLINALQTNDAPAIVAQGSGNNDGIGTASNSIGSQDIVNLVFAVNKEYRESPSAGFLMSSGTLAMLSALIDKYGQMLNLVRYESGKPMLLNFPVYICPSMPEAGQKDIPIVFGDISYWHTRIIVDSYSRIRVLKEAPGLIENGNYGLQMFMRADGVLATDSSVANPRCRI
jgi:HK97 family phage major capsid protein